MTSFAPPATLDIQQNLGITPSNAQGPRITNSTLLSSQSTGLAISCFTMIFGTISNLTGLGILGRSRIRFRRQSRAPFLSLTVALLLADLGGHVIPGAFALYLHINQISKSKSVKPTKGFCNLFGAIMVFFGLCPLLLGCAMAVERWVAITKPFFHASTVTVTHIKCVVLLLSTCALVLAVLPFFGVGNYTTQTPGTWCFLPVHDPQTVVDTSLVLVFSCVGLIALTLSLLCNILSCVALFQSRAKSLHGHTSQSARCARRASSASTSSLVCSLDVEMMVQLVALTVVSCVCWSPFLLNQKPRASAMMKEGFILVGLRMASWNQILDPWVYILFRRAVLLRVCCGPHTRKLTVAKSNSCDETQ
uniref:Thromboxane A2 receptor n=1 Tax=Gouania willdenowi TaxID=441366 RepID=A0A8C5H3P5_GOUWI